MSEMETEKKSREWLKVLPGIVVSIIVIALLLMTVDVSESWDELLKGNYRWMLLSVAFFVGTLSFRSLAARRILSDEISFSRSFWTINEGYLMNNVLPFRLGELGRALMLNLTEGMPFWRVLSAVMVERILDVSFMAVILLATLPFVEGFGLEEPARFANLAGIAVVVGLAVLYLFARYTDKLMGVFEFLLGRFKRLADFARDKVRSLLDGLAVLADFRNFAVVVAFLMTAWVFNVLYYWATLRIFFPEANFLLAAFMVGITSAGVSLPSSPGYIGVFHGVVVYGLGLFGYPPEISLAFAIVVHLLYEVITISLGAFGLSQDGLSLFSLFGRVMAEKEHVSDKPS